MTISIADEPPELLDIPEPYLYEKFIVPSNSFGTGNTTFKEVNITFYRNWLNTTIIWSLQKSIDNIHWLDCSKLLTIKRDWYPINLSEKHTLSWVSDETAYYQLLLKTDDVKSYQDKSIDAKQAEDKMLLSFSITETEDYNIYYDWSDYKSSAEFSKTSMVKDVRSVNKKQTFNWMVYTNVKMAKGEKMVIDPSFGDTDLTATEGTVTIENCMRGGYYQMGAEGGTADNITFKINKNQVNPAKLKYALYDSSYDLIANGQTEEATMSTTGIQTVTIDFVGTKPTLNANEWYVISVWGETVFGVFYTYRELSTGDDMKYYALTYASDFPGHASFATESNSLVPCYCSYSLPPPNEAPIATDENPANNSESNALNMTWSVNITDETAFNWTIECSNGQNNSANDDTDGIKNLSLTNLTCETNYTVWVNTTDGSKSASYFYYFNTVECPSPISFSNEYPLNNAINVCPCCDVVCISVIDTNATIFNLSVDYSFDNITFDNWFNFNNVTNGTYCFCMDGMQLSKTYYWNVNCTTAVFYDVSDTFSFSTEVNKTNCSSSDGGSSGYYHGVSGTIGLMGLLSLALIPILLRKKERGE